VLTNIHQMLALPKFYRFTGKLLPYLFVLTAGLFCYGIFGALFLAPADYQQGEGFRIIYVHVPSAYCSLAIYSIMAVAALLTVVWRIKLAAMIMKACLPIGALFTLLALITGSIWGKPMWGTWWIWDARLTSELILLLWYLVVMGFQQTVSNQHNANLLAAILVLIGVVNLPIIHFSVIWWNTLHQGPTLTRFAMPAIDPQMLRPLLVMIAASSSYCLLILVLKLRSEILWQERNKQWVRESIGDCI